MVDEKVAKKTDDQNDKTKNDDMVNDEQKDGNQVWNEAEEPLKPDEELDFDSSAYEMLHRSEVEWPCLSIDVLVRDRCPATGEAFGFKDWFSSSSLN